MAVAMLEGTSNSTFLSAGLPRLEALWRATMRKGCPAGVRELFATLLSDWGEEPIPESPGWPSDVGDDHSPYEFSLALGGAEPEVRILVEAQARRATLDAYWRAGLALTERVASDYGAVLTQLHKVQDLFRPESRDAHFAMWHAVCLFRGRAPEWKIYLSPQARGAEHSAEVVEEALTRLGYPDAWKKLSKDAAWRGPQLDEVKYFSLDLSARPGARVKVYFRHHRVTAQELERSFSLAKNYVSGDTTELCATILGGTGPFNDKPVGSSFAYIGGDLDVPSAVTMHLPVNAYIDNDGIVRERVVGYLRKHGISTRSYIEPLAAFANRPLRAGAGMQSYVSFRRDRGQHRLTIYLPPELYRIEPPVVSGQRTKVARVPA